MGEIVSQIGQVFTDQFGDQIVQVQNSGILPMVLVFSSIVIGYVWYELGKFIYTSFLAHRLGRTVLWLPSPTSWAVITGGTNGIGLEYANKLSKMGYSLLLLARDEKRLQITKEVLLKRNPNCTDIKTLSVDFTKTDIYDKIRNEIDQLEHIDVLVNSVGMFTPEDYFLKTPDIENTLQDLIYCNTLSMTQMTNICLRRMVDQKRGVIINISSFLASYPVPLMAMYSSTKVYVDFLSRALELEYRDKGIVIQSVLPGFVGNKMFDPQPIIAKLGMTTSPMAKYMVNITAPQFVSEAIKTVGVEKQTFGHWFHKLLYSSQNNFIQFFGDQLFSYFAYYWLKLKRSGYDFNQIYTEFLPQVVKND